MSECIMMSSEAQVTLDRAIPVKTHIHGICQKKPADEYPPLAGAHSFSNLRLRSIH